MRNHIAFEGMSERNYLSGILLISIFYLWQQYRNKVVFRDFETTSLHESLAYFEGISTYIQPLAFCCLFLATLGALLYLIKPSIISTAMVLFPAFFILGATSYPGKIDHNTNFFIYVLFVLFFNELVKKRFPSFNTLKNIPLIFLTPFFIAGCYKFMQILHSVQNGAFIEDYGHSMILNLMILTEAWNVGELSYLAKIVIKYYYVTYPFFFVGVLFQLMALPLAYFFEKRIWVFGVFFIFFNLFSGMVVGAFFAETFLLGLFVLFLYPRNQFFDLSIKEIGRSIAVYFSFFHRFKGFHKEG